MTKALSKGQLEFIIRSPECYSELEVTMARALLAAHEQEPVATVFKSGDRASVCMIGADLPDGYTDVFAHPAPSIPAAVPEEITDMKLKKAFLWIDDVIRHNPGMKEAVTCRAAMLQSEPVEAAEPIYEYHPDNGWSECNSKEHYEELTTMGHRTRIVYAASKGV